MEILKKGKNYNKRKINIKIKLNKKKDTKTLYNKFN